MTKPTASDIAAIIRQRLVLGEVAPHAPVMPLLASIETAAQEIVAAFEAADA